MPYEETNRANDMTASGRSRQGWRHAQDMVHYELDQLSTYFTRSVVVQEPGRTAHRLVEGAYEWVFLKTGMLEWVQNASAHARTDS